MDMKKLFSFFVVSLFVVLCSAHNYYGGGYNHYNGQNLYMKVGCGVDISFNDWNHPHNAFNAQVGYYVDYYNAVELDYSHGSKNCGSYYNRIGFNYVHECGSRSRTTPYFKLGAAYKNNTYIIDEHIKFDEVLCDFKVGFGFHHYITPHLSLNLGLDATNGFNNDVSFAFKNITLQTHFSLAYNF
jgi:hypothetical protein